MLEFAFIAYIDWEYGDKQQNRLNEQLNNLGNVNIAPAMFQIGGEDKDDEDEGGDGNTCLCFKILFNKNPSKKSKGANVWEKSCDAVYKILRRYFDKRPKVVDKLFRLIFLVAYLMVLLVLFLLPIQNKY